MRITKKPDIRKEELLNLAKNLFLEKGYEAVSIREIVNQSESMGSPGLFYYYFKSKKDIYQAVVEKMADDEIAKRLDIYNADKSDPRKALISLLSAIKKDAQEFQKFRLSGNDKQLLERVSQRFIQAEAKLLEQLLYDLIEDSLIPTTNLINADTTHLATSFLIHGANGILANLNPDDNRHEAVVYIKAIISYILSLDLEEV